MLQLSCYIGGPAGILQDLIRILGLTVLVGIKDKLPTACLSHCDHYHTIFNQTLFLLERLTYKPCQLYCACLQFTWVMSFHHSPYQATSVYNTCAIVL